MVIKGNTYCNRMGMNHIKYYIQNGNESRLVMQNGNKSSIKYK